jgi:hypothetical protein
MPYYKKMEQMMELLEAMQQKDEITDRFSNLQDGCQPSRNERHASKKWTQTKKK